MLKPLTARLVTEQAAELCYADGALLECVMPTESICLVAVGSLERLDNSRGALNRSLGSACVRSTSPLVCNDVQGDERVDAALCNELATRNLLSVASRWRDDETGVLTVINGRQSFTDSDARVLGSLLGLLSTTLTDGVDQLARTTLTDIGASGYQQVLDAIADMVIVKGSRSRIIWANKAFREVYGMTNEQLRGLTDSAVNEPDFTQKYVRDDAFVFETGKTLDIPDEQVTRHDGAILSCHTVKCAIHDSDGKVAMMVAVCRDVTDKKRLEVELRSAQKLEAIGRLSAGIAHEINTPMQFIGDNASYQQTGFEALIRLYDRARELCERAVGNSVSRDDWNGLMQAEAHEDLAFLRSECSKAFAATLQGVAHVTQIVSALKVFAHTDHEAKDLVDVNQLLRATLTIAAHHLKAIADVETDFAELPRVLGYAGELNQVFLNLFINAADAIADVALEGKRGRIRVRSYVENDQIVASIADTGPGIPPEIRERVFEPFFTTKEVGRGTGQGLALAHAIIVDKHQGKLYFDTVLGVGTTFYVTLPLTETAPG